jgi:hypothetical protein
MRGAMRRIRTCSSDTALDDLEGSDVKAQSLKHQAGIPDSSEHRVQPSSFSTSTLATPPRGQPPRAASEPPERKVDAKAKLEATRHAKSARLAEVHLGLPLHTAVSTFLAHLGVTKLPPAQGWPILCHELGTLADASGSALMHLLLSCRGQLQRQC